MNKIIIFVILNILILAQCQIIVNEDVLTPQQAENNQAMQNVTDKVKITKKNSDSSPQFNFNFTIKGNSIDYKKICTNEYHHLSSSFIQTYCKDYLLHNNSTSDEYGTSQQSANQQQQTNQNTQYKRHVRKHTDQNDEIVTVCVGIFAFFFVIILLVIVCIAKCIGAMQMSQRQRHRGHQQFQQVLVPMSQLNHFQMGPHHPPPPFFFQPGPFHHPVPFNPPFGVPIGQGRILLNNNLGPNFQQAMQPQPQPQQQLVQYFPQYPVMQMPNPQQPMQQFVVYDPQQAQRQPYQPQQQQPVIGYPVQNQSIPQNSSPIKVQQQQQPQIILNNQQPIKQDPNEEIKQVNNQQTIELQDMNIQNKYPVLAQKTVQNQYQPVSQELTNQQPQMLFNGNIQNQNMLTYPQLNDQQNYYPKQ